MNPNFPFDLKIKNSKRAKNLRITLKNNQVILIKPFFIPKFLAFSFLKKNQNWIKKNLAKSKKKRTSKNSLYYLGKKYKLNFQKGKLDFEIKEKILIIKSPSKKTGLSALLKRLKKEAKYNIQKSAQKHARLMNQKYNSIRLKDQSTRWGSASNKKNLNFNWRLIMAPPQVLDYVVIHELAHFKHMNHSRKFWNFVEKFDPDYRQNRRWLTRHQNELIFPLQ